MASKLTHPYVTHSRTQNKLKTISVPTPYYKHNANETVPKTHELKTKRGNEHPMTIAAHGGCRMKARPRHLQRKAMEGTARHGKARQGTARQASPSHARLSQASPRHSRPCQAFPRQVMARVCTENWRPISRQPHPTEQTLRIFAPKSGGQ